MYKKCAWDGDFFFLIIGLRVVYYGFYFYFIWYSVSELVLIAACCQTPSKLFGFILSHIPVFFNSIK